MMRDELTRARALLETGCTCVLVQGEICHTSTLRGVAPLLNWLDNGVDLQGFSAADKVVGRAAAFLYVLLGVRAVHANVLSTSAEQVLARHGIAVSADTRVAAIRNRAGDGFCPMEQAVLDAEEPQEALSRIRVRLAQLRAMGN